MHPGYRVLLLAVVFCLFSTSVGAQCLYVSDFPGLCTVEMAASIVRGQYRVSLYAPDPTAATGAYFRLEVEDLGDEDDVVVTPEPGVTFNGDIRTGMSVSFSSPTAGHHQLLTLSFVDHDPPAPAFSYGHRFIGVRDAVLVTPGGAVPMEDMDAIRVHCYGFGGISFRPPASPEVVIGRTTPVTFTGVSSGGFDGPGATNLVASDTEGWVGPFYGALWNYGCGECPWFWQPLVVTVTLPDDVPVGATSLVTVSEGTFALTQFVLEAVATTPVEATTWGAVKALYR